MANTAKLLGQAALGVGNTTIYTVPAATTAIFSTIRVVNTDTVQRTFRLFAGAAQGIANAQAFDTPIAPGAIVEVGRGLVLAAGQLLVGLADAAAKVAVTAAGVEIA